MANIRIEAAVTIPQEVVKKITTLNPAIRGVNPRMEGSTKVACGCLTWKDASRLLQEAGIPHTVSRKGKSAWDHFRVIYQWGTQIQESSVAVGVVEAPPNLQLPDQGTVYLATEPAPPPPERTYSSAELLYNEKLNMLDEKRALPLHVALSTIADWTTIMLEPTDSEPNVKVSPWHLVEFKPSGSGNLQPCLTRLDRISGPLKKCTWGLIHAFERDKNIPMAEAAFGDALFEVLDDPDALRGFRDLALEAAQEQPPPSLPTPGLC